MLLFVYLVGGNNLSTEHNVKVYTLYDYWSCFLGEKVNLYFTCSTEKKEEIKTPAIFEQL